VASSKRDERLAAWLLFLWRFAGDFLQPPAFFTGAEALLALDESGTDCRGLASADAIIEGL
jgi:hypothetical protein